MKKYDDICIIDDDAIAVFGLKRSMESLGLSKNISIFENGLDAFENFKQQIKDGSSFPSLIFIDLNMPIMDGWNFMEEFDKAYPSDREMPIIFIMSSSINPKDREKAKIYNLEGRYLEKPITSDVLRKFLP